MSTTNTLPKFDLANLEVEFSVTREQFHFPKESGIPVYLMFKQEIVEDKTGIGERIRTRRVRQADGTLAPSATAAGGAPANNEDTVYTSVVIDLQTGEECSIIVHRLLKKALDERYTGTEYIDKILMVIRNSAKSGRGEYHTFVVKQMKLKQQAPAQPNGQTQQPAQQQARRK